MAADLGRTLPGLTSYALRAGHFNTPMARTTSGRWPSMHAARTGVPVPPLLLPPAETFQNLLAAQAVITTHGPGYTKTPPCRA